MTADREVREAFNAAVRRGFGRGLDSSTEAQDRGRQIDGLDAEIEEREAALDAFVRRRDNLLFKEEQGG